MKCLFISHYDKTFYLFRKGIVTTLIALGCDVVVACPMGNYTREIESLGAKYVSLPMKPFISPVDDLLLIKRAYGIIRDERPDLVHCMSVKPNIYGTIAAKLAKTPRIVSLVCGVGHAFNPGGFKKKVLRKIVSLLYRVGARYADVVWMLNKDDMQLFADEKIVPVSKMTLIRSEGIDMKEYSFVGQKWASREIRKAIHVDADTIVVYMGLGRALWSKGIKQFVEASQILAKKNLPVKFVLACPLGPKKGADSVPCEFLESNRSEHFQWLGERDDVKDLIAASNIVTLPAYYREGVPRSLLEAMAMKRPIVTTDHVGSRETVDHGVNGFLVPPKNSYALSEAIEKLVLDRDLRERFGEASYQKCLAEFEESLIVRRVLRELYDLPEQEVNRVLPVQLPEMRAA
ncbi:MAG: glycosyltransferase family 4 protein [Planctomycetia bacterium]|jgi:glycosyltransferase involved in cell wall biosynthesis